MNISLLSLLQQVAAPQRPAEAHPAAPAPARPASADPVGRRDEPAVEVRLSAAALRFLNGEGTSAATAASPAAEPAPRREAAFEPLVLRPAEAASADAKAARGDPPARLARPGSRLDITL